MGATSRSMDMPQISYSCRHLDEAALRNLARGMSSARVTVWKVDSGLKAGCGMTSDWNTCWSYAQDHVRRVRGFDLCQRDTEVEGVHSDDAR